MSGLKTIVRHGFAGSGAATLVLAGLFVVNGGLQALETLLVIGWLIVVGVTLLLAGTRERLAVGGRAVGWPRVAAIGVGILGIGCAGFGLSQLRTLEVASGAWLLTAALTVFVVGYVTWFARECWTGGRQLDEEMFAVER
ncbi:hypothetical protein [Natrinema salaciae]|uniref:Uncharacterized protein n=1 Tax=Natrinema salaciae TaxID=1186196 RepID=A0A1H9LYZ3_9EURY|nr:hypothetical protein [Natrinema salaciae]SER16407.1 hypothetical protein SAMN04489841_3133 [Natrinema salaciae]